jgi:hypothetical protein
MRGEDLCFLTFACSVLKIASRSHTPRQFLFVFRTLGKL